jgi:DNA-binding IclR family transcriptional regulator
MTVAETDKEVRNTLRLARKGVIAEVAARVKEQQQAVKVLKQALQAGGRTVPELAQDTGLPAADVLWYLAALKKYGEIAEGAKAGSYFRYTLAALLSGETAVDQEISGEAAK